MVDGIIEGILEIILEIIIDPLWNVIFHSKAKKWVKTVLYLLLTQPMTIIFICFGAFAENITQTGRYVFFSMAAVWCIATVIFGFYMLNRKRKKS